MKDDLNLLKSEHPCPDVRGALLSTRFKSFEELKKVIKIEYFNTNSSSDIFDFRKPSVRLTHHSDGQEVVSILKSSISEKDIMHAQISGFLDRAWLGLNSPYFVINKNDLLRVFIMARRRYISFGEGDVAFYDLSENILHNISDADLEFMSSEDLSDKGYFNSFNHITSQVFMTAIFSERLADFIADIHELGSMPELTTGKFTEDQLTDLETGVIDNYVDLINNEWGQELGKKLRKKYDITRDTYWNPELLANFLNDIQVYYSWAFQIGFKPFKTTDEVVIKFSYKINVIMGDVSVL